MAQAKAGDILAKFFDEGAYTSLNANAESTVVAAFGSTNGCPVYVLAQTGAALNKNDTAKTVKVMELAAKTGYPMVTFYDSKGADLTQGLDALTGASEIAQSSAKLSGVVPQIAVVTGVCGGIAALTASSADVCIAMEGSELFFTPPFTSEANGDVVKGAGCTCTAGKAGIATLVAKDLDEAVNAAKAMVSMLPANNLSGTGYYEFSEPTTAIDMAKYTAEGTVAGLVDNDSAIEFYAEFGKSVYTAIATIAGGVVGVVATEKDKTLCKNAVSKASRFVRLCDAFGIPVVSVVNTKGFTKSTTEDIAGGTRQAARLAGTYAEATTAKICVVTGSCVGAAYTAFGAGADVVVAMDSAVVAPICPMAAATVLYKDEITNSDSIDKATAEYAKKYIAEVAGADALLANGVADLTATSATVRANVIAALDMMSTKRVQRSPKKHGNMPL